MAASIEESLMEKLRGLPLEKQQEVLEFVEKLGRQETRETIQAEPKDRMPIWERRNTTKGICSYSASYANLQVGKGASLV
jgi:hypothetical protein